MVLLLFTSSSWLYAEPNSLLINRGISGANHLGVDIGQSQQADFFVHNEWLRTYSASQSCNLSLSSAQGVAEKLNVKDGAWVLDSVEFFYAAMHPSYYDTEKQEYVKVAYKDPILDSLQIQIWQGEPFAKGSTLVWGDSLLKADIPFTSKLTDIRYAERYIYDNNNIQWNLTDTCKLFSLKAKFPSPINLPHGEYYIAYVLKASHPDNANVKNGVIKSLVYNAELPYEGEAIGLTYGADRSTVSNISQENQRGLSLALNLWGEVTAPWQTDVTISGMSEIPSCDMSKAVVKLKIKNLGQATVNITDQFKIMYAIDILNPATGYGYIDGDTVMSKLDFGRNTTIAPDGEIELAYLAPAGSEATSIDLGSLGETHRVRAWIEWNDDSWTPNNKSQITIINPGKDIATENNGNDIRYSFSFPSPVLGGNPPRLGMMTTYPNAYTPTDGGWTLSGTDSVYYGQSKRKLEGIMWKPATAGLDTAMNQWLFSDCLDLEAGVPYKVEVNCITFDRDFTMEVKLGSGLRPEDMTQTLQTVTLKTDSSFSMDAKTNVLTFTPTQSGVQNLGFRQVTPTVSAGERTSFLIWSMSITKLTPHRIEVGMINLPESSCGLTNSDSVSIDFKNLGYESYTDSIRVDISYTKNGENRIEKEAVGLISLKARMGDDEVVRYTFPSSFDLSEEGLYRFDVSVAYKENGKYVDMQIPFYAIYDSNKVASYYPLNTPVVRDFSNLNTLANWKDITANIQSGGMWEVLPDSTGRTSEGILQAVGVGTTTNAWYRTSCLALSADSIYEVSVWVKYGGQGASSNAPTFKIGINDLGTPGSFKTAHVKVSKPVFAYKDWTEVKTEINVTETKSYYIGLNYTSKFSDFSSLNVDDFTLKAVRAKPKYTVTLSVNDQTMGTVSGEGSYDSAATVKVLATPMANYEFVNWTENDAPVSTDTAYSFVITGPRTLKANFREASLQHTLILNVNNAAWGTVLGAGTFRDSAMVSITATPTPKVATFVAWKNGDVVISTDSAYTFMLLSDMTLTAEFNAVMDIEADQFSTVKMYASDGKIYMEGLQANTKVQIMDVTGRVIESAVASSTHCFQAPQNGIYIVRLFEGNKVKGYKLSVR